MWAFVYVQIKAVMWKSPGSEDSDTTEAVQIVDSDDDAENDSDDELMKDGRE